MTSQLMVKINVAPFSQVNKTKVGVSGELLSVSRSQENNPRIIEKSAESIRIAQLEQNIKFLQDQHHTLLNDLHSEIESLRNKNRDLQFQLIVKNQPTSPATSTSSSDDEHKISSSPNQTPFTSSLHVELLEKMIGDLKIQLQENENKNVYLSSVIDEQKKKLEKYDRDNRERDEPDLRRRVEEADSIIRQLQQENNLLRNEHIASPSHYHHQKGDQLSKEQAQNISHSHRENGVYHQNGSYQKSGRGNRRNNSSNYRGGNWFPPLQSQNYWQNGGNRSGGNHHHQTDKKNNYSSESTLPNLKGTPHQYHERRNGNNNHYNGDGSRHRREYNNS